MKKLRFGNITIFIIFFGIALIEAIQNKNWFSVTIFVLLGILFIWSDMKKNQT